jgi:hypothetical protein
LRSGSDSSALPERRLGMLRNCGVLFTLYSQLTIPLLPARGVRLETQQKTDKKNSELYFRTPRKNFLTEKNPLNSTDFPLVMEIPSAETSQNINSILMPGGWF